jgi:hypothetical protein
MPRAWLLRSLNIQATKMQSRPSKNLSPMNANFGKKIALRRSNCSGLLSYNEAVSFTKSKLRRDMIREQEYEFKARCSLARFKDRFGHVKENFLATDDTEALQHAENVLVPYFEHKRIDSCAITKVTHFILCRITTYDGTNEKAHEPQIVADKSL